MKHNKLLLVLLFATSSAFFGSCSDNYMEEINTDISKANDIDPNSQLTNAILATYGNLNIVDTYRNYLTAFTQHLMGSWDATTHGGRNTINHQIMDYWWTKGYTGIVSNLVDAEYKTKDDPDRVNINAVTRIYYVYIMSIMTDLYGDIPYSEAGKGFLEGIFTPRYDKQKDIYYDFFKVLADASSKLNPLKDKVTGDVIYYGDIDKWRKLANSLRMRFAMRISNVDPEKAKAEFEAAISDAGGVFSSNEDDALIKYMEISMVFGNDAYTDYRGNALSKYLFGMDPANNQAYICSTFFNFLKTTNDPRCFMFARCYYDGLISSTEPDNRIDITQEMIDMNIPFAPRDPGAFSWEPWPSGYNSPMLTEMAKTDPRINPSLAREVEPKLSSNFLKSNNPGVVMTYSEVMFLMAEAAVKGWNIKDGTPEYYYKKGIRAAIDFVTENYGFERVSDQDFDNYYNNNPIGKTNELKLKSINTQAWILHFLNPTEAWANIRRSGYPVLKSAAEYGFGAYMVDGQDIPVRFCYPVLESSYNKDNYDEAIKRMGGNDSWYNHLWWDK